MAQAKVIEAERIVLRDQVGTARLLLTLDEGGSPVLAFFDAEGRTLGGAAVGAGGLSFVTRRQGDGRGGFFGPQDLTPAAGKALDAVASVNPNAQAKPPAPPPQRQKSPDLMELMLGRVEEEGWPALQLPNGETIPEGEDAWREWAARRDSVFAMPQVENALRARGALARAR